jgi:hypothetical protein
MPITNINEAVDEISGMFKTAWAASSFSSVPINWDDVKQTQDDQAHINFFIEHNETVPVVITDGPRRFRMFGIITAQCFAKKGSGRVSANDMAQVVLDCFCGKNTGADKVSFRTATPREVGVTGAFYQINAIVEFDYDMELG